jgi:hypothetical protein
MSMYYVGDTVPAAAPAAPATLVPVPAPAPAPAGGPVAPVHSFWDQTKEFMNKPLLDSYPKFTRTHAAGVAALAYGLFAYNTRRWPFSR